MANYIKNSRRFSDGVEYMTDEQIMKAIKKCFRYAQDKAQM
jgi:hypothetical protein